MTPAQMEMLKGAKDKWTFKTFEYGGGKIKGMEDTMGTIEEGLAAVKENPAFYSGVFYQTNMTTFPADQQKYTFIERGSKLRAKEKAGAPFTYLEARYQALPDVEIE